MWKNIVEQGRQQMTIWRMRTACCIPKATNTHSEFVHNYCSSVTTMVMRTRLNTYIACLVFLALLVTLFTECITGRYLTCDPKY